MFLAMAHLIARDHTELLLAIMEYFPDYYQEFETKYSEAK